MLKLSFANRTTKSLYSQAVPLSTNQRCTGAGSRVYTGRGKQKEERLRLERVLFCAALAAGLAAAQPVNCDMGQYKAVEGLKAENRNGAVHLAWQGERGDQLRASFTIRDGQPVVLELAART